MKVVCIGDSITAGQYLPPEQAWPQVLAELTDYEVMNAGVANETTRNGLERFPRHVQDQRPDVVIIQFGLNDCNRWDSDFGLPRVRREAFRENLIEMVERTQACGAEPVLCGLTPTQKSLRHITDAKDYNRTVVEVSILTATEFFLPSLTVRHLMDAVHLTAEGHRLYAERMARTLSWLRSLAPA